jgi:hypothetical protein
VDDHTTGHLAWAMQRSLTDSTNMPTNGAWPGVPTTKVGTFGEPQQGFCDRAPGHNRHYFEVIRFPHDAVDRSVGHQLAWGSGSTPASPVTVQPSAIVENVRAKTNSMDTCVISAYVPTGVTGP